MTKRLIIILGYTLTNNCEIQPILKSRLDAGLSVHQATDKFLVCGKMPPKLLVPARCEKTTEAEAMKQYLVGNQILAENIIKEEQSTTTFRNAFYGLDYIKTESPESIIIIANEFHYPLIKYSFDKVLGSKYNYSFHIIQDASLSVDIQKLEQWRNIVNNMVETYYPILFSDVKDGDIDELKAIIEGPINPKFEIYVKDLLHLDESADIREFICG